MIKNQTSSTPEIHSTGKIRDITTTTAFYSDNNQKISSTSSLNNVNNNSSTTTVATTMFSVPECKPDCPNRPDTFKPLPAWLRFYIYGLHGVFDEVVFTALYDVYHVDKGNRQLLGYSTLFSFFIYASCSFFVERLYIRLYYKYGVPVYLRIPIYLVVLYTWELTSGLLLRQLGVCSWDYSHYAYNFMGLITLEYAPAWCILCILQDIISDFMLTLRSVNNISNTKTKME